MDRSFRSSRRHIVVFLILQGVTVCFGKQMYQGGALDNDLYDRYSEPIIPQTSCFYENYKRTFTCECPNMEKIFSIDFKLGQHLLDSGKEIRGINFRHCNELDVKLNLREIDATNYPINFRSINFVNIKGIIFEPRYSDRQELILDFYNVEKLHLNELTVRDTLEIHAINIKQAKIVNSTFAHIPNRGFTFSYAKSLEIQDSYFSRIARGSIVVDKTREVLVSYNQMTVNALEIVVAKDGSKLSIFCNRLLNQPISPECIRTTTTTTTTTTPAPSTTETRPKMVIGDFPDHAVSYNDKSNSKDGNSEKGYLYEIIGGAIGGLLVIVIILLLIILLRKRNNYKSPAQENLVDTTTSLNGVQFGSKSGVDKMEQDNQVENKQNETKETDSLILGNEDIRAEEEEEEDDNQGPKFASPIWLEEIQRNKIFNRQKSLLSEDRLADLASAIPNEETSEADTTGELPLPTSRSPLPEKYSQGRSPIPMEEIPETREELPHTDRNTSPGIDLRQEKLPNSSHTALESNGQVSTNLTNDDLVYNKQNEYAV